MSHFCLDNDFVGFFRPDEEILKHDEKPIFLDFPLKHSQEEKKKKEGKEDGGMVKINFEIRNSLSSTCS